MDEEDQPWTIRRPRHIDKSRSMSKTGTDAQHNDHRNNQLRSNSELHSELHSEPAADCKQSPPSTTDNV